MKSIKIFLLVLSLLEIFFLPTVVLAESFKCVCNDKTCKTYATLPEANTKCVPPDGQPPNYCQVEKGACPGTETANAEKKSISPAPAKPKFTTKLDNPLVGVYSVTDILGNVIRVAMAVMGGAVLVMVVKGATTWITAAGNPENIQAGTKTILWAILGAILTVVSYIILSSIIGGFFSPLAQ